MGEFSLTHLLLLAVIFLVFFGPSRLPQLGQSLGKAIRGFKDGLNEIDAQAKDITNERLQQPTQNNTASSQQHTNSNTTQTQTTADKKPQA